MPHDVPERDADVVITDEDRITYWKGAYDRMAARNGELSRQERPLNAFGIVDPDYARIFTQARCIAWSEGYALVMHGSFTRDLDLIAVPWAEQACEPEHLVRRIEEAAGLKATSKEPSLKPHGRLGWTLMFPGFADPRWVDLSVLPAAPASTSEAKGDM